MNRSLTILLGILSSALFLQVWELIKDNAEMRNYYISPLLALMISIILLSDLKKKYILREFFLHFYNKLCSIMVFTLISR